MVSLVQRTLSSRLLLSRRLPRPSSQTKSPRSLVPTSRWQSTQNLLTRSTWHWFSFPSLVQARRYSRSLPDLRTSLTRYHLEISTLSQLSGSRVQHLTWWNLLRSMSVHHKHLKRVVVDLLIKLVEKVELCLVIELLSQTQPKSLHLSPPSFFIQLVSGFPKQITWPTHFQSLPVPFYVTSGSKPPLFI